jgi:hypothetical protein
MALGQEQNTKEINLPGVYKDPQSGEILEVKFEAAADALVRLNWERIGDVGTLEPKVEEKKGK